MKIENKEIKANLLYIIHGNYMEKIIIIIIIKGGKSKRGVACKNYVLGEAELTTFWMTCSNQLTQHLVG